MILARDTPDGPPLRQPTIRKCVPSKVNAWYGTIDGDHRFTLQQQQALIERGLDPLTVETITVRRQAQTEEWYWPMREPPPTFTFECPVVQHMADRRIKVIGPAGLPKLVRENGWVHRPYKYDPRERW